MQNNQPQYAASGSPGSQTNVAVMGSPYPQMEPPEEYPTGIIPPPSMRNKPPKGIQFAPATYQITVQPMRTEGMYPEGMDLASAERLVTYPHEFVPFRNPVIARCIGCGNVGKTQISYQVGDGTYITVLILCLLFMPASLFPCCCPVCKDVVHKCSSCGKCLGSSKFCS